MTLYYKNWDRITTKIDVDYKTNTVTKSVKRRMGAWRVIITPLNLHNSESLVIIMEMNKDYDGGRLSASKGNHGVAGKSSVFWM